MRVNLRTRYVLSCEKNRRAAPITRDERHRRVLPGKIICVDSLERRSLVRHAGVHVHEVCVTFTRAHMYVVAHVCGIEETRLKRVVARGGWRGRIGASEAEASLLGDYGSLIPIQRSELHAKRKSRPPESRRYHAENVWSRRRRRSPLLVMSVLRVAPVKVAPLKNVDIKARARLFPLWFHEPTRTWVAFDVSSALIRRCLVEFKLAASQRRVVDAFSYPHLVGVSSLLINRRYWRSGIDRELRDKSWRYLYPKYLKRRFGVGA